MTDHDDVTVESLQRNDSGLVAEITGECVAGNAVFKALFTDESGKPTANLVGQNPYVGAVPALLRTNDDRPVNGTLPNSTFKNQLLLKIVPPQAVDVTWRVMAQIGTTMGDIVLKIPLYEEHVNKLVGTCTR